MSLPERQCRPPAPKLYAFFVLLCLFCFMSPSLSAQSIVLFVGHLNQDAYPDTVTGRSYGGAFTKLPEMIIWGKDPVNPQPPPGPPTTQFVYPNYLKMAGSVSFVKLNPGDELTDMLFFLWGYKNSASVEPDTGRAVAIFGQAALSTTAIVKIDLIQPVFQATPFFAQDVQVGVHLNEPKVRDLSDVESYLLGSFNVSVQPPPHIITSVGDSVDVHIYPNPSVYTTTIEASLPAGSYTAKVVGVSGQVFEEQHITLTDKGTLWHNIDVSHLVSGYYVIQLVRNSEPVGTYPFIIKR